MNDGTLTLNSVVYSIGGTLLVVGDGIGAAGSAVVQSLGTNQIQAKLTINSDGAVKLNGHPEILSSALALNGSATLDTGAAGLATLSPNSTININSPATAYVFGNLNIGSGTCTVNATGYAWMYANLSGAAGLAFEGPDSSGGLVLAGSNSFTGPLTVDIGRIWVWNSWGCGATNGTVTLNNGTLMEIYGGINVTNKALVINSTNPQALYAYGQSTNSWAGNITLNAPFGIQVDANSSLDLIGPITGTGGFTKVGPGPLWLSGTSANTYSGTTRVSEGSLLLNKSAGWAVGAGSLIIGDGVGGVDADVVRYTGSSSSLLNTSVPITITNTGLLDLNNKSDDVGPITLGGGDITTGAGYMRVNGNLDVLSASRTANITGHIGFINGLRRITAADGQSLALAISATLSDNGWGLIVSNNTPTTSFVQLLGSNDFTGPLTIANARVSAETPWALGSTNGTTTVGNNGVLWLYKASITNESLTLQNGATLNSQVQLRLGRPHHPGRQCHGRDFGRRFRLPLRPARTHHWPWQLDFGRRRQRRHPILRQHQQ